MIASPVRSNIYLDRLDQFVKQRVLPDQNLGRCRLRTRAYQAVEYAIQRLAGAETGRRLDALTDRRGVLPKSWISDLGRLQAAGIPDGVGPATKPARTVSERDTARAAWRSAPVLAVGCSLSNRERWDRFGENCRKTSSVGI